SATPMPMSWLNPALPVNRSMLALSATVQSTDGVIEAFSLKGSMTCQVAPSLEVRWYCRVLTLSVAVTKSTVIPVGEYLRVPAGTGPAPAWIFEVPPLLVFHCSLIV